MSTSPRPKRSRQGPLTLWHMLTVRQALQWAALRPQLHWSKAFKIFLLPGMTVFNSVMRAGERLIYGRQVRDFQLQQSPLFIIGHWRSGTTLLHNLIAQDPQLGYPTMYQAAFCNHFLLTQEVMSRLTGPFMPKTRPMDNLPAGWDIPQEEDIAIAILSLISPYVLAADPDRPEIASRFWDLKQLTPEELQRWRSIYVEYLKRVTLKDPQRRRLVLKSPVNTLRIPILLDLFPDAHFVHIYRNPADVYRSCLHLRQTLFGENCLGRPHMRHLEEQVFERHLFGFETYRRDRELIPAGRLHEIRFEELEIDPIGQLEQTYTALGLSGWDNLRSILEPQVPALKRYKKNAFPDNPQRMQMIYDRLRPIFEYYNYPQPEKPRPQETVGDS
ncbi:MAG: sulfotransferase family protein [Planctomycetaceae bacterium]